MQTLRHQLNTKLWVTVLFLLAQVFVQALITAHASEHAFHQQGSYCDVLDHADHQQGNGITPALPLVNLIKTGQPKSVSTVTSVFVPRQYAFHQRAPPVYLY